MPAKPIRAAVLVPAPDFHERWNWAYDNQAAALEAADFEVVPIPWTHFLAGQEQETDLVLPLVAWGYHLRHSEWLRLLDGLEVAGTPTLNPVTLLRWNSDKTYLTDLANKGVRTVPTIAADLLDDRLLTDAARRFGTTELVVKPSIGASADGAHRVVPGNPLPMSVIGRRMLIQPFQNSIATKGELSLMLFNGVYSHAVIKRPKAGDFRVQAHLGGREQRIEAPDAALALAHAALVAAPAPAAYARVDMVADDVGQWQIMELELIEPALFLPFAPGSAERFGTAIAAAAKEILATC